MSTTHETRRRSERPLAELHLPTAAPPPRPAASTARSHGDDAVVRELSAVEASLDATRVGAFFAPGAAKDVEGKQAGSSEARAVEPTSPAALPTAEDLAARVAPHLGTDGGRAMARDLEALAPSFGVPAGGFSGQTNLYGSGGMPVAWYTLRGRLGTDGHRTEASSTATTRLMDDLGRASMVTDDPALLLAVTMREHSSAWTASRRAGVVNTYEEGGLDFLGDHLGPVLAMVPAEARTGRWRAGEPIMNSETASAAHPEGTEVHPAIIPAADQLVAYAAELERAETLFDTMVDEVYGEVEGPEIRGRLTEDERRAWIQFTFGRPGRTHAADHAISDQQFSTYAALELLHSEGSSDLGAILDDPRLGANASVRRARTTALEARWIEDHLLQ